MNLTDSIASAEYKFKKRLEEFFITTYCNKPLTSHGIDHHRRVWRFAKRLLHLLNDKDPELITNLPSRLIIACYLHDIGMSIDTGERHGHHSKKSCHSFLDLNNLKTDDYIDVLEAIEYHDKKDYPSLSFVNKTLKVLSVADDLDAFGFIGIYRYSEIYLTRGVSHSEIGYLINKNASIRYNNFQEIFGNNDPFLKNQTDRYNILYDFFNNYNKQISSHNFDPANPSGYFGIIANFQYIIDNHITLEDYLKQPGTDSDDPVILWYFEELEKELADFSDENLNK